jgi:2-methylcitrate dehydratase PrpD
MSERREDLTRRSVLKGAGVIAAAAAFPVWAEPVRAERSADGPDVTGQLSSYMSEAGDRPLPPEVVAKAKQHLLDTLAAMISGVDLAPARIALKFARSYSGEKVATVVGSEIQCGPVEAALANGMLAHSDETDDSHSPSHSHPGCAVVPAVLAAGEKFGIGGERLLRAIVLGYDIGTRVTMSLGGLQYQMHSHRSAHSIANTFGASAAAACAAGLNAQQMRWVLDYAAQQASGIAAWQRDTQHIEKSMVFAGFPARNGVTAALLIQLGATGVEDIFFGSDNFFAAFGPNANPAGLIDQLGERFEITRTNIKKWTVGSPIQAPLDALQTIMKEHPFKAEDVQSVTVRMAVSEARTVNNRDMPDISLQQMIAVMLVDRTVSFRLAHDEARMRDPRMRALRSRVKLVGDEQMEKLYPQLVAAVEVTLKNGSEYRQRVDAVRGTARNPMTRGEVEAKARDLMTPFLGGGPCDRLIQAVFNLEKLRDIRQLTPLLRRSTSTET